MSVWNQSWDEWRLWGPGYGWSTRYTATCKITVTRSIGSDTATVKVETTMTTPSGDNALGDWQCIPTINGATSGGGEKNIVVASAGYHAANSSHSATQTFTVGVGVSAGTLSGTVKFRIGGYPGYQGEYSEEKSWSLAYDSKGTPSQATWSNYYWGKESTVTIQRTVPAFRESVYLVWSDNTTITLRTYTQTDTTTVKYTIPYNACPTNAKTRVAKIRVVTYNGSTQVGAWESANYTVALLTGDTTYLPTLANNPVCEAYNDVVAALGTDTAVAQYSKINVKAAKADVSCKYSATIASRVVTFSNGSSASADQTNHISSLIQAAGTISWTYTVTDSRGYTVTRSGTYTVINSSAPSIENVTVYRGDSGGTAQEGGAYIYATATATCESLNGHNSVTLQGKVDSGAYQSMTSGTRKTLKSDADANTQYLVTLTATDLLRPTSQTILLPSLDCPLDIPETKHAVGIGMQAQASDDTFYVGYKTKLYGDLIKHDSLNNRDADLVRLTSQLAQTLATDIVANSNLNTPTLCEVGQYFCGKDVTAATLTNCPTGGRAFMMNVFAPIQAEYDFRTGYDEYRVREILTYKGKRFIQELSKNSSEAWTYGAWNMVNQSPASEGENVAQWLKAMVGRQTSLDFPHIYDGEKVHCRLDIVSGSLSSNPFDGDGYVLTFMWDNSGGWDTQVFFPNGSGHPSYRKKQNSSWGNAINLVGKESGSTTVDGVTWTWDKYDDGYVDMYADITLNGTWISWGNLYVLSMSSTAKSLPFTLTKKLEDVTTYRYTTGGSNSAFPVNYYLTSDESKYFCDIARPSAGNNNTNYYCRKYIRGKI